MGHVPYLTKRAWQSNSASMWIRHMSAGFLCVLYESEDVWCFFFVRTIPPMVYIWPRRSGGHSKDSHRNYRHRWGIHIVNPSRTIWFSLIFGWFCMLFMGRWYSESARHLNIYFENGDVLLFYPLVNVYGVYTLLWNITTMSMFNGKTHERCEDIKQRVEPCSPEAWQSLIHWWEIIPFYGRKIQVSELWYYDDLPRYMMNDICRYLFTSHWCSKQICCSEKHGFDSTQFCNFYLSLRHVSNITTLIWWYSSKF